MSTNRNQNLDILRVVSMALVVVLHYASYGTTRQGLSSVSFDNGFIVNSILFPLVTSIGTLGVLCFVLISSHFMCGQRTIRFDKVAQTWLVVFFYSVLLSIVGVLLGSASILDVLRSLFPLWSRQYWFVNNYIALVLLAPFISETISSLPKKSFQILLGILAMITLTISMGFPYGNGLCGGEYSFPVFVFLFAITAYEKRFGLSEWVSRKAGYLCALCLCLQWMGGLALNYLYRESASLYGGFSVGYNAFSVLPALFLFVYVKGRPINPNLISGFASHLAPYMFSVYLLHDNIHIRWYLWNVINPTEFWNDSLWLPLMIMVPFLIISISCAIDYVRRILFRLLKIDKLISSLVKHNITLS